jgi:hypothetical protein
LPHPLSALHAYGKADTIQAVRTFVAPHLLVRDDGTEAANAQRRPLLPLPMTYHANACHEFCAANAEGAVP